MPFTTIFGAETQATGGQLDTNFNEAGALGTLPFATSGTNALTLTPVGVPAPTATLQRQGRYSSVVANTNTGPVTASINGLGALGVYKDTPSGPQLLSGGELVANNTYVLVYDAGLAAGAGGFHVETSTASSAGTVTNIATGSGLSGGPITNTGTISLAAISAGTVLANITGASAVPIGDTLSAILDALMSSAPGAALSRGASLWTGVSEASYTPVLSFGGTSTGITYTTQVGQQFAIGFFQIAMFNIVLSSKGSATGAAAISLPAPNGGGNRVGGGIIANYANLDSSVTTLPFAQISGTAATAALVTAGTGTVAALTDAKFTNTSTISGVLFYLTG